MKKSLSVLLALVMLFGCFSMVASAKYYDGEMVPVKETINGLEYQYKVTSECTCENADHFDGKKCHCCVKCPNLDISYLTKCATENNENGEVGFDGTVCCEDCTGITWGCNCGCVCCGEKDQNLDDNKNNIGDFITDEDKQSFVDGFQAILKKISDAFDAFFDAIFAFLKIDKVLGTTK